jgi:hypothetical protein
MQESLAHNHSIIVHPTYSVEDKLWFTDDGVTAKSLAALKSKLGARVTIADYYPNGYQRVLFEPPKVKTSPWDEPLPDRFKQEMITEENVVELTKDMVNEILKSEPPARVEEDTVLELEPVQFVEKHPPAKEPEPEPEPASGISQNTNAPVGVVYRLPNGDVNWRHFDNIARLRDLMARKLRVTEVARRFGVSKNVIIGACHRKGIPISDR